MGDRDGETDVFSTVPEADDADLLEQEGAEGQERARRGDGTAADPSAPEADVAEQSRPVGDVGQESGSDADRVEPMDDAGYDYGSD